MILSSRWVIPISSPYIEEGAIVIEDDRILALGPTELIKREYPGHQVRSFGDTALIPGFVNAHCHMELTVLRGYLEELDFWDWIRKLTRTKYETLDSEDILVSALLGAVEAIRSGVTTIADPMDLGTSLDASVACGLRGVFYQEVFSPRPDEADEVMEKLRNKIGALRERLQNWRDLQFIEKYLSNPSDFSRQRFRDRQGRVTLGVSPHSPFTVSAPLFQKVDAFARSESLPVCIHVAESDAEISLLQDGAGPIMDSYRKRGIHWSPLRCTPIQYLHRLGVIHQSVLLVHCIRLEEEDYATLQSANAAVAYCPKSNARLGHGFMNLREMRRHRIRLGLGSDSVASNNSMDPFEEMRFALSNPFELKQDEKRATSVLPLHRLLPMGALRLATLGGAEALGLDESIGSLERGKQADVVAVDLSGAHTQPVFSPIDTLVLSARAADIRMTMVAGEILYDDGMIAGLRESEVLDQVSKIRRKLINARSTS